MALFDGNEDAGGRRRFHDADFDALGSHRRRNANAEQREDKEDSEAVDRFRHDGSSPPLNSH